MQASWN